MRTLVSHRRHLITAYPHLRAPSVPPVLPNASKPYTDHLATRLWMGWALQHCRHQSTHHHSIPIIVSTRGWESIWDLTHPIIQPTSRTMPRLTSHPATHITGEAMAQGAGTRPCIRLRLTQVGQGDLLQIKPRSCCTRP